MELLLVRLGRHSVIATGIFLATLLFASPVASAAPSWLAPAQLASSDSSSFDQHVAVDPQGNAIAVWSRYSSGEFVVEADVRPAASGVWQAPVQVSTKGEDAQRPDVAIDQQGNAIVVWQNETGGFAQAAVRPAASGVWQAPVTLGSTGEWGDSPEVVIDPQGNAVAVWTHSGENSESIAEAAVRPVATGAWQEPVALSGTGGSANSPSVAVDPQGNVVAVWANYSSEDIESAVRPVATGVWQLPVAISTKGTRMVSARVAVDQQGNAIAIWSRYLGESGVEAAVRPAATGVWQMPVVLSTAGEETFEPKIVIDSQGNATAVWEGVNASNVSIDAAARPQANGIWQTPVQVSVGARTKQNIGEFPELAVDSQDNVIAVWDQSNGSNYNIEAAVRPSTSGVWQTPTPISVAGQDSYIPQVAVDPKGDAVAIWERQTGGEFVEVAVRPGEEQKPKQEEQKPKQEEQKPKQEVKASQSVASPSALALTHVWLTHRVFSGLARRGKHHLRVPVGTTFHFTLSNDANVLVKIRRVVPGLRRGHKCLAPSRSRVHGFARRCVRDVTVGMLTKASEPPGSDSFLFSGRVGGKHLLPSGHYEAVLYARNAGGYSAHVTLRFSVRT